MADSASRTHPGTAADTTALAAREVARCWAADDLTAECCAIFRPSTELEIARPTYAIQRSAPLEPPARRANQGLRTTPPSLTPGGVVLPAAPAPV